MKVDLTRGGIKTYWGVWKRAWRGEPEITKYQKALLGGLITDYPMPETSFRVVKNLPPWPFPPEETLTLQLVELPAMSRWRIGRPVINHSSVVRSVREDTYSAVWTQNLVSKAFEQQGAKNNSLLIRDDSSVLIDSGLEPVFLW